MLMFGAVIPARRRLVVVQLLTNEWSLRPRIHLNSARENVLSVSPSDGGCRTLRAAKS